MTIDQLLAGSSIPTLAAMRECIEEFLIDREEPAPDEVRAIARKCLQHGLTDFDDLVLIVFARRDECGPIMKQIAAGISTAFAVANFMGKRDEADLMSMILKAEAGVKAPSGHSWPSEDEYPEADPRFLPVTDDAEDTNSKDDA